MKQQTSKGPECGEASIPQRNDNTINGNETMKKREFIGWQQKQATAAKRRMNNELNSYAEKWHEAFNQLSERVRYPIQFTFWFGTFAIVSSSNDF